MRRSKNSVQRRSRREYPCQNLSFRTSRSRWGRHRRRCTPVWRERVTVMRQAVKAGLDPALRSASGLTGGDAAKLWNLAGQGGILDGFLDRAVARALAVAEYNAAMGRIVAAPTAGSCGILPGTVISVLEEGRCTEKAVVMSLFTAGAVGMVIGN